MKGASSMDYQSLVEKTPFKMYNAEENKSYLILSVCSTGVYYYDTFTYANDDDFSWSPYSTIDVPTFMSYEDMDKLVVADEPTEKQVAWLEQRNLMTLSMTKQEAWKIINDAVNEYQAKAKRYMESITSSNIKRALDSMLDEDEILAQTGHTAWDMCEDDYCDIDGWSEDDDDDDECYDEWW